MSESYVGYVSNVYSSTGQVQVRRFGHDDSIGDETKCKWCYVDQGSEHAGVAGVGQAHTLQSGCRVQCTQYGGADGSMVVHGTFGRMGSGQSGGGGGESGTTSYTGVNYAQTDYVIPIKNPGPNGQRAEAKVPDNMYHKAGGGQPLDLSNSKYPTTQYKKQD
jgi:hypothetical protein